MAPRKGGALDADALMREFTLYDRCVDVVSVYHWLFTETRELPSTVRHFERYPRIEHPDGNTATPDFTVLFHDGRAIVAEIASIALNDGSADSLCAQLGRYDQLTHVPGNDSGQLVQVDGVDVMFLSPMETAPDAARRIYAERIDDATHPDKPARRPFLVQFAQTPEKYILQPWADVSVNGVLTPGNSQGYDSFSTLNVRPELFAELKVRFGFANDPVPGLYMATRLWMSVFPSVTSTWKARPIVRTTDALTALVREQYGRAKHGEVQAGLDVLQAARLANRNGDVWTVKHQALKGDVAESIVARLARPDEPRRSARASQPALGQGTLF